MSRPPSSPDDHQKSEPLGWPTCSICACCICSTCCRSSAFCACRLATSDWQALMVLLACDRRCMRLAATGASSSSLAAAWLCLRFTCSRKQHNQQYSSTNSNSTTTTGFRAQVLLRPGQKRFGLLFLRQGLLVAVARKGRHKKSMLNTHPHSYLLWLYAIE